MLNNNNKWECWVYNAIHDIPCGVALSDAIKAEEILKKLYKDLTGKEY